MAFLELTHVKKTFGRGMNQVHALRDINLTVERGSFVAIMGESGAGKYASNCGNGDACWK